MTGNRHSYCDPPAQSIQSAAVVRQFDFRSYAFGGGALIWSAAAVSLECLRFKHFPRRRYGFGRMTGNLHSYCDPPAQSIQSAAVVLQFDFRSYAFGGGALIWSAAAVSLECLRFKHFPRRRYGFGRMTGNLHSYCDLLCPIDPKRRRSSAI